MAEGCRNLVLWVEFFFDVNEFTRFFEKLNDISKISLHFSPPLVPPQRLRAETYPSVCVCGHE
jgi:hypothetical protein